MYHVYAIKSIKRKYIYVGMTNSTRTRIARHNKGQNKTTKPYKPFRLIHLKSFIARNEARKYEKYLKSGCGKEYLKSLICPGGEIGIHAGLRNQCRKA